MKKASQKKCVSVGGEMFEEYNNISYVGIDNLKTLQECYNNCSSAKRYIYNYWFSVLSKDFNVLKYGVASFNAHFITLSALLEDKNGNLRKAFITPAHNFISGVLR